MIQDRICKYCRQSFPRRIDGVVEQDHCVKCLPQHQDSPTPQQSRSLPGQSQFQSTYKSSDSAMDLTIRPSGLHPSLGNPTTTDDLVRLYRAATLGDRLLALHSEHFKRERTLGKGGMGLVQQVLDKRLDRSAALKTLQSDSPEMQMRFLREAKITARLDHPSIPPIYELGKTPSNQLYLLMKVIRGETLQEKIRQYHDNGCPPEQLKTLLEVVIKACDAVAYAHSHGIIHRDLKPENIMVAAFGEVLVLDWGIAKDTRDARHDLKANKDLGISDTINLTQVGTVLGTLGYMPPEQADGQSVNEQADVFAMGAVLTCILTGRPPIDGPSNINRLNATLKGDYEVPSDRIKLPSDLNFIAEYALESDLDARAISITEFANQLRQYLSDQNVEGYDYSLLQGYKKSLKRKPERLIYLLSFLSLFLVLAAALLLVKNAEDKAKLRVQIEKEKNEKLAQDQETERRRADQLRQQSKQRAALLGKIDDARRIARSGAAKEQLLRSIQAFLTLGASSKSLLMTAADICGKRGFRAEQESFLKQILDKNPDAYDTLYKLHVLELAKIRDGEKPTKWSQQIIKVANEKTIENEYVMLSKALNLTAQNKLKDALELYNKINVNYLHDMHTLYNNRAVILMRKEFKDLKKAVIDLSQAISMEPNYVRALINRGEAYKLQYQDHASLADLDRAVGLDNQNWRAFFVRSCMYTNMRQPKIALRDLGRALGLVKVPHPSIYQVRAANYARLKNNYAYFRDMGTYYKLYKDYKNAEIHYNQALSETPRASEIYFLRGQLYAVAGAAERARNDFQAIIRANNPKDSYFKLAKEELKKLSK